MDDAFVFIVYFLIFFLSLLSLFVRKQWGRHKHGAAKLPPGSMGWPYIGETLHLFSQNPDVFFNTRQKRYGEIFKTHVLGYPCIMLASPEAARFVLLTKASLFKPTYPKSKERLIGAAALFYQQGPCHSRLRKLVQGSLSLDKIQRLIPKIEAIVTSALHSWSGGRVVHTFHELKKLTFEVAILVIFGDLNSKCKEKLKENYYILDRGYNSFPTKIPGTKYYKSALARQRLGCLIKEIVRERLSTKRLSAKNLLDCLLSFREESGKMLTDDHVVDNVIGVLFAAQDTTASLFTWVLKYITDKDKLLEAIKEEQKNIHEFNDQGMRPLTWAQTRSTPVTNKVILETLRMASIISFTYREATEDVIYDGHLIPKGWKVLPLFRSIHHNPTFHVDPQSFDPSRFEDGVNPHTFMPFGCGSHACPGNELAKLEMFIFIHHLVSKFRWEVVGPYSGVQYSPFPVPEKGLPAKFWELHCRQRSP